MADLGQLETALQNAHAAGDTEAATILATELAKSRKTTGPVTLGDIGSSALNDVKKAGSSIVDFISGLPRLPSRMGGAVQQYEQTGDYNPIPFMEAASVASPVSPAARIGEKVVAGVAKSVTGKKPVPTANALTDQADINYGRARTSGVEFSPDFIKNGASSIAQELEQQGLIDAPKVASGTHDILRRAQTVPAPEPGAPPAVVTMANIDAARRSLRAIAQNYGPDAGSDRAAASIAIDRLDNLLKTAGPQDTVAGGIALPYAIEQIEKGRGNVAAAKRSNVLTGDLDTAHTGILERGEDRAAAANSGQNTGNSIRSRIASLLANKKQLSGWSPEEIAQAETVNKGTVPMNASRWLGNFMGGGGGLGAQITSASAAGIGALLGGVPGAAAGATAGPIVGASSKAIEGALTRRQANNLNEMLLKRSPLYEETPMNYTPVSPERRAAVIRALMLQKQQQQQQ